MGHNTRQAQKYRPYKIALLTPPKEVGGIFHNEIDGWKEQNRKLRVFMTAEAERLNIFKNTMMLPVWALKVKNYIKTELPLYQER